MIRSGESASIMISSHSKNQTSLSVTKVRSNIWGTSTTGWKVWRSIVSAPETPESSTFAVENLVTSESMSPDRSTQCLEQVISLRIFILWITESEYQHDQPLFSPPPQTDVSKGSLLEGVQRYNNEESYRKFPIKLLCADCFGVDFDSVLSPGMFFNFVNCQVSQWTFHDSGTLQISCGSLLI